MSEAQALEELDAELMAAGGGDDGGEEDVGGAAGGDEDPLNKDLTDEAEIEALQKQLLELEKEANEMTGEPQLNNSEDKGEADQRSVFVGNVDYSATADDLERHFHGCGSINRVTILCDKFSGHPKGYAYIEFADKDSVDTATALNESLFKGRQIKVTPKRTNRPGVTSTNRPPRGRGRGRGAYMGRGAPWMGGGGGFRPRRPYGRRGGYGYSPY